MLKIFLPSISLIYFSIKFNKFSFLVCSVSLLITSVISLSYFQTPLSIFNRKIFFSRFSLPLFTLTLWISALIVIARSYTQILSSSKLFLLVILILNNILIAAFSSSNLFLFYLYFEASLIPTLILILGWGYQPERLQAGVYLIIYTIFASLPLLLAISLILKNNSHLSIILRFKTDTLLINPILEVWRIIIIFAFLVKIPLYSTHLWLPKAHVEAPVAGSIILAGLLLKLGGYGVITIISLIKLKRKFSISIFIRISLIGAIVTRIICLRQPDLKSLIAYSSVGHIALLIARVLLLSRWGFNGRVLIIIAHGLCSSALFFLAFITYQTSQTRSLFITKGLVSLIPNLSIWWFLFCIFNIAAPPSINLISEIILLTSILRINFCLILFLILIRFLAAAYSLILYTSINHGHYNLLLNSIYIFSPLSILNLALHLAPIILLATNPILVIISY